jgi:hypothetical protein
MNLQVNPKNEGKDMNPCTPNKVMNPLKTLSGQKEYFLGDGQNTENLII